ncbi:rod shape-determining protein MreC [Mesonia hippocampi]|uniref:Cell shape-determining protein MreC n=1 Tax=Mesonia hippocampi TaxID=1628250 RepID=A0A840EJU5_9FLAO|nr:rod shape-determining protein MreC [Mesonia hippocampi]MBB4119672.1 rod shape-determining protein MreC [Mesonia hippocampi]
MQQIINFLIRYKNTLLFLLLLTIALFFTIQSHQYHKSKFINSTNFISGGIYTKLNAIDKYFYLEKENNLLLKENKLLREQVASFKYMQDTMINDSVNKNYPYHYITAKVIRNQYNKIDNFILINKGDKHKVNSDLGVITSKGIVGIIEKSSTNYARIISILNTNLSISAQLKKTEHFGSLLWDGKSPNTLQLQDIPRMAPVKVGDTIVTSGKSFIFPKGIPIGVISDYKLDQNDNYGTINVHLFNDMTSLSYVYVIKNNNKEELSNFLQEDE